MSTEVLVFLVVVALAMVNRLYPVKTIVDDLVRLSRETRKPVVVAWVASAPEGLEALDAACRDHGFFLLSGHGLDATIAGPLHAEYDILTKYGNTTSTAAITIDGEQRNVVIANVRYLIASTGTFWAAARSA